MPYSFTLNAEIPASPQATYEAWLDSAEHSAMTGAPAKASQAIGSAFTAWDGYISGRNKELVPGERIAQFWRTSEFGEADADSLITVTLAPSKAGALLTLVHSGVPDGERHKGYENGGWEQFYFAPMKAYFAGRLSR